MQNHRKLTIIILFLVFNILLCSTIYAQKSDNHSFVSPSKDLLTPEERQWLADHPNITLGQIEDFEPFMITNADGSYSGMFVDLVKIINTRLDTHFKVAGNRWPEILQKVKDKEIDGTLSITLEHCKQQGFLPTKESLYSTPTIFAMNNSPFEIRSLDDLKGKKVCYVEKTQFVYDILGSIIDEIEQIECKSCVDAFKLVFEGKADACVAFSTNNSLVTKYAFNGLQPKLIMPEKKMYSVMGIRDDYPELVTIINKALVTITEQEYHDLHTKWSKIEIEKPQVLLTTEEKAWLANNPSISMAVPINVPRSYYSKEGKIQGMTIDLVSLIEKKLGITFEMHISEWNIALKRAKQHEVDIIVNAAKIPERETYLNFTEPYFVTPQALIALENKPAVSDLDELNGQKIAVHKGSARVNYLKEKYPGIEVIEVVDKKEILTAVITEKVDAGFDNYDSIMAQMKDMILPGLKIIYLKHLPPTGHARIGVQKDKPLLVSILNKAIKSVSEEEKNRIMIKWLGIEMPTVNFMTPATSEINLTTKEKAWLEKHPVIRVGLDPAFAPYSFLDDNGYNQGASIDFITKMESILGISIEPQSGLSWKKIQQQAQARKLDVITPAIITEERKEYLLFSDAYLPTPLVITCRIDDDQIISSNDLTGKRVAIAEGYASSRRVILEYPGIIQVPVNNPLEGIQAVSTGKADAYVCVMGVIVHLSTQYGIANLKVAGAYENDVICQRFGIRSDWPELVSIFNKALHAIPEKEKLDSLHKWVPVSLPTREGIPSLELLAEEYDWLKEHPVIRVASDPYWNPIEYRDENGKYHGISREYLNILEEILNIRFECVADQNWQQLVGGVKKREIDMFSCVAETPERSRYVEFTNPYITFNVGIFTNSNVAYIADLSKLNGKKISVVAGYAIEEWIRRDYPEIELITAKNIAEALEYLQNEQVFAYVGNLATTGYYLNKMNLTNIKVAGNTHYEYQLSMAIRSDWPILRDIIQKALDAIPQVHHNEISQSWLSIKYEHGFDYTLLWRTVAVGVLIIIAIIYWNYQLGRAVNQRTRELEESESQFRTLVSNIPGISYRCKYDDEWTMTFISTEIKNITGYPADDFIENKVRSYASIIHPEDRENVEKVALEAVNKNEPFTIEYRIIDSGDQTRWVFERGRGIYDIESKIEWLDGAIFDITEQKLAEQKLQKAEIKFRTLYESNSDAIMLLDKNVIFDCNNKALELFGFNSKKELCSAHPADLSPYNQPDGTNSKRKADEIMDTAIREGSIRFDWYHTRHYFNEVFPCEITLHSMKIDEKTILQASVRDITKQKQAKEELERAETKYRTLYETNADAILLMNEHKFIDCNEQALKMFGFKTKEEFHLIHPAEVSPLKQIGGRDSKEAADDIMERALHEGSIRFEWLHKRHDTEEIFPCDISLNAMEIDGKNMIQASIRDISERIKAEKELLLQRERLDLAQRASQIGMFDWDIIHNGAICNDQYYKIYGLEPREQMISKDEWLTQVYEDDRERVNRDITNSVEQNIPYNLEYRIVLPDKTVRWVKSRAKVFYDKNNEPYRMIGTTIDISEQKQAEELMKNYNAQLEAEVNERTEELKNATSQLIESEKMATIGQIAANVAHEINTPLGAIGSSNSTMGKCFEDFINNLDNEFHIYHENEIQIKNLIERISESNSELTSRQTRQAKQKITNKLEQMGIDNPETIANFLTGVKLVDDYEQYLPIFKKENNSEIIDFITNIATIFHGNKIINTAVKQSSRVVNALREYISTNQNQKRVLANIAETINTALDLYNNKIKHGIELTTNFDKVPSILCHPHELSQVWSNIINNAIQAMENSGNLSISLKQIENNIQVAFTDSGPGIPDNIRGHIFEPLFTTKTKGEGTGLGLDIVKRITDRHNGQIDFVSEEGKGTKFTVTLPVDQNEKTSSAV